MKYTHTIKKVVNLFQSKDATKENYRPAFPGKIVSINGTTSFVELGISYVWVNLWDADIGVVPVINYRVSPSEGLPVLVTTTRKKPPRLIIEDINVDALLEGSTTNVGLFALPNHAQTHRVPSDASPGDDPLYIYQAAMKPLKIAADGTTLVVTVGGFQYYYNNQPQYMAPTTFDLTSYVPAAGSARYVLLYFDASLASVVAASGNTFSSGSALPPPYPEIPDGVAGIACAFIRLADAQTAVAITDVTDVRPIYSITDPEEYLPIPTKVGDILYAADLGSFIAAQPVVDDISGNIVTDDLSGTIVIEG